MSDKSIAIVICSTRPGRLGHHIAKYVLDTIQTAAPIPAAVTAAAATTTTGPPDLAETITTTAALPVPLISMIDLATEKLPLYDEPAVPSHLSATNPTPEYAHEHTRAWSEKVRTHDGFVFVTPQYNWSVPAALKNALDYLFHEWGGKPAGIVSYGSRGGPKGAKHLRDIMGGLRMRPVETAATFRIGEGAIEACEREGGATKAMREAWAAEGQEENVRAMFREVVQHLNV